MERDRSYRRHHKRRMKDKALWIWKVCWNQDEYHANNITYIADHLKYCTCDVCGNPRRYFGMPTIQERREFGIKKGNAY